MKYTGIALSLSMAVLLLMPGLSSATNAMFLIGHGAKSRAMGGIGVGYTRDAIQAHMNPAGITGLKMDAMRIDASAMLLYTPRSVGIPDNRPDPAQRGTVITYDSGSNLFLIPSMGMVYKFNRKVSMGFSFVGAGGGSTRYTDPAPHGFNFLNPEGRVEVTNTLGVNLMQAQMAINLAYKINKRHSIAFAPTIGIQTFRAYGLGLFRAVSNDQEKLTNNGNDWSYGAGMRLGYQGKSLAWLGDMMGADDNWLDRLTFGAAYSSKIYFTDFDKYSGLFAESGNFDSPATLAAGVSLDVTKNLVLAFDWQRTFYSDIAAINNPIELLNNLDGNLGEDNGAGFGWEDQDIYKLGLNYRINKEWDVSVGWSHADDQIPEDQLLFSTLAPAVITDHLTLGATYKPNKTFEWSVAYVHGFRNKAKGQAESQGQFDDQFPNNADDGPGDMFLEMRQDSIEGSFTFKM